MKSIYLASPLGFATSTLAAMPIEQGATSPSNRDHDKALYGGRRPE